MVLTKHFWIWWHQLPIYIFFISFWTIKISAKTKRLSIYSNKTRFQLIFANFGRPHSETYSDTNFHSLSSLSPLLERKDKNRLIQNETLNIEDNLSEASLESAGDNENVHQYHSYPPYAKKIKHSNKIEQQQCLKNCNKSRIERNVEFDCRENMNNLQHVTRSSD